MVPMVKRAFNDHEPADPVDERRAYHADQANQHEELTAEDSPFNAGVSHVSGALAEIVRTSDSMRPNSFTRSAPLMLSVSFIIAFIWALCSICCRALFSAAAAPSRRAIRMNKWQHEHADHGEPPFQIEHHRERGDHGDDIRD